MSLSATSSVDEAYAALREKGVTFAAPPERQPWGGYMAMLEDPEGNIYYLDEFGDH